MTRRVTAPTVTTLIGLGTFAVPDLTEEQRAIVHRCLKEYDADLSKMRSKMKTEFGIGDDLYTPVDRQIDIMRGVIANDTFGKRMGGLMDMFKSDSESTSDQIEMETKANEREEEARKPRTPKPIEMSDGPPRLSGKDRAAGEKEEEEASAPSLAEIEAVEAKPEGAARNDNVTLDLVMMIAPEDTDHEMMLKSIASWSDDFVKRVDAYCGAVHLRASDNDDVVVPKIPRLFYEALIRTSDTYRTQIAANVPADDIDDTPVDADDGDETTAETLSRLSRSQEAAEMKITTGQLDALRKAAAREGEGAEFDSALSASMLKKLRSLGVIKKVGEQHFTTQLGKAVIAHHEALADGNVSGRDEDESTSAQSVSDAEWSDPSATREMQELEHRDDDIGSKSDDDDVSGGGMGAGADDEEDDDESKTGLE